MMRSGDSGEAERLCRREAERHSGMIPNTTRGLATLASRLGKIVSGFVKRNLSGSQLTELINTAPSHAIYTI